MGHKKRNITLLILLALLCIAGTELAACRHFEPEIYEAITAPVRAGCEAVTGFCRTTARNVSSHVSAFWAELTAPRPEPGEDAPVSQKAEEPVQERNTARAVDPAVTTLIDDNGRQYLTGGTFLIRYFNQGSSQWGDLPYGTDDIANYGCGPTAMAMAVASMTGTETDPAQMAQWAVDHGHWARGDGSYLSIVEDAARSFGLEARSVSEHTPEAIREELLSGKILVALMGPGHFTQHGHFILIRAATLTGEVLVADPNSMERSLMPWDPQLILDELSGSTSSGAPLWSLAVPLELPPT